MALAEYRDGHAGVELLQRSLQRGRLGHAYLFSGGDLAWLEGVSRNLAKALNCTGPLPGGEVGERAECCDECSSCRRIDGFMHPDVLWVRPESKSRVILIDQVREVLHAMNMKAAEARTKVAVLADADRMNPQAANAFLKTLEEPPGRAVLILLSTRPQNLMDTILSRCLALRFGDGDPPLPERVQRWLERFAEAVRRPGRSLLNRYQVLGDLLSELGEVRSGVEKVLKSQSPLQEYDDADSKLRDRWEDELKAGVESEYRRVRTDFINGLQWFFRDVWFQAAGAGDGLLALPQLREATGEIAARASAVDASCNLEALNRAQRLLETNLQESLVLEVALLRLRL